VTPCVLWAMRKLITLETRNVPFIKPGITNVPSGPQPANVLCCLETVTFVELAWNFVDESGTFPVGLSPVQRTHRRNESVPSPVHPHRPIFISPSR